MRGGACAGDVAAASGGAPGNTWPQREGQLVVPTCTGSTPPGEGSRNPPGIKGRMYYEKKNLLNDISFNLKHKCLL